MATCGDSISVMGNSFQTLEHFSFGMMRFLIPDVFFDPRKVPGSKTYHPIAGLPLQGLVRETGLLIDVMRLSPL